MSENKLNHIAIIMDGNRRWAKKKNLPIELGHKKGAENVASVVEACAEVGIGFVTLYAFSTENWGRDKKEVDALMHLLKTYLDEDVKKLMDKDVRIVFIGERSMLDKATVEKMAEIEKATENNKKITTCIAVSYGSRHEILNATKNIAMRVKNAELCVEDIDFNTISEELYTNMMPDPDLLIRTSGEQRVSNYLLWQLAYAELYFSKTLWPDFGKKELLEIINSFNSRERRYGKS